MVHYHEKQTLAINRTESPFVLYIQLTFANRCFYQWLAFYYRETTEIVKFFLFFIDNNAIAIE